MKDKLSIREKAIVTSLKWAKPLMLKNARRNMEKLAGKHELDIIEIQELCGDKIEAVPEKEQNLMVAIILSNILQGFDTKKEMDMVIEMVQTTVNEYWKNKE